MFNHNGDCFKRVLGDSMAGHKGYGHSINKHCGGSLRKQLAKVRDAFWKSSLPKTGQGALIKLRQTETVLFSLAILLLLGSRSAALFCPG